MGVGFSFGAKDGGLNRFLKGLLTRTDEVSAGIRGFGISAAEATQPMDNLIQSMSAKSFNAIADAAQTVTNVISSGLTQAVLVGSNVVDRAQKKYTAAGQAIDDSFQNLGGSIQGVYDLMVGDRLKKFASSIPVERFQKMGTQLSTTMGIVKSALGVGLKKDGAHLDAVAGQAEHLGRAIGPDLASSAREGAEKFKRSADQNVTSENAVASGFRKISDQIFGLDKSTKSAGNGIKKFMGLFSLRNLAQIGQGLAHIGSEGGQLTTTYEAMAQSTSVSVRKTIAMTGIFGKELTDATGKATGLAMGMKVSEQIAGNAVATMKQFGGELKAFGIDSAETGVKLEDGLGVPIRDLGFNVRKMRDGLKLSDKELEEVSKSFTATGEAIHDMVHPLQNMPALLELAQRRSNLLAQGMSSIGGKDSIKSMNKAIQSLFVLTGDAKGAQEGAVALEQKMVESMENFRNMFAGTSTDLDAFLTNTSVVTGDVRQAFKAAEKGPDAFIKEFSGVIARLKKDGKSTSQILQFFGGQMSEALGPDLANTLITALGNADDAKVKMLAGLKDVGRGLGDVAKESWRSSMTMQESFDLMMGAAESRFRSIGRAAAVTFVHDTGKAFNKFNDNAERLVKEGGPLGSLVEKMSQISSLGAKALLPEALRPMAQIFSHMAPMVFQAVSAFGAMVPVITMLGGPGGILVALVATLTAAYLMFKQVGAHLRHIGPDWTDATKAVAKYEQQLKRTKVGTEQYAEVSKKLAAAKAKVADLAPIKKLNDEQAASQKAMAALQKQLQNFKGAKEGKQYQELTKRIAEERKKQADIEAAFDKEAKARATKEMQEKIEAVIKTIKDNIPLVEEALKGIWEVVAPVLGDLFDKFEIWFGGKLVDFFYGGGHFLGIDWGYLASSLWKSFKDYWSKEWDNFSSNVTKAWDSYVDMVSARWNALLDVPRRFFKWIQDKVDEMFGHSTVVDSFARGFDEIEKIVQGFWNVLKGIFDDILAYAGRLFEPVLKIVDKIFNGSQSVPDLIAGGMDKAKAIMEDATKSVTKMVEESFLEAVTEGLTKGFVNAFRLISEATKKFFTTEAEMFAAFTQFVVKAFREMWITSLDETDQSVQALKRTVASAMSDLKALENAVEQIKSARAELAKTQNAAAQAQDKPQAPAQNMTEAVRDGMEAWYLKYQQDFDERTMKIVSAVKDLKVVQTNASGSAAGTQAGVLRRRPLPGGQAQPSNSEAQTNNPFGGQ